MRVRERERDGGERERNGRERERNGGERETERVREGESERGRKIVCLKERYKERGRNGERD